MKGKLLSHKTENFSESQLTDTVNEKFSEFQTY